MYYTVRMDQISRRSSWGTGWTRPLQIIYGWGKAFNGSTQKLLTVTPCLIFVLIFWHFCRSLWCRNCYHQMYFDDWNWKIASAVPGPAGRAPHFPPFPSTLQELTRPNSSRNFEDKSTPVDWLLHSARQSVDFLVHSSYRITYSDFVCSRDKSTLTSANNDEHINLIDNMTRKEENKPEYKTNCLWFILLHLSSVTTRITAHCGISLCAFMGLAAWIEMNEWMNEWMISCIAMTKL